MSVSVMVILKLKLYANHTNHAFEAETGSLTEVSRVLHWLVSVNSWVVYSSPIITDQGLSYMCTTTVFMSTNTRLRAAAHMPTGDSWSTLGSTTLFLDLPWLAEEWDETTPFHWGCPILGKCDNQWHAVWQCDRANFLRHWVCAFHITISKKGFLWGI